VMPCRTGNSAKKNDRSILGRQEKKALSHQ